MIFIVMCLIKKGIIGIKQLIDELKAPFYLYYSFVKEM